MAGAGDPIVNRSSFDASAATRLLSSTRGLIYSRPDGRPVPGRCWRFWYLQRSKKVWFRLPGGSEGQSLLFRYDGRPILHRRELTAWSESGRTQPLPVVWGKDLGIGWDQGPQGTTLFLHLWTRWTWLHPEACGQPQRFSVDCLRSTAAAGSERCPPPGEGHN